MKDTPKHLVTPDPWVALQTFTDARIGLGRCGSSLPLAEILDFKLAHARARDAVHQPAQLEELQTQLAADGIPAILLTSSIVDRMEYLTRPDKGRTLSEQSKEQLQAQQSDYDICIVICDGLSAPAIHESATAVVSGFMQIIAQTRLTVAPICMVKNGRVAIGDEIGSMLGAKITIMLIGERPGLSSPNSLGTYLTYNPKPGTTDEARNCISNIRNGGMSVSDAVRKIAYLVEMGLQLKKTGVELKDKMTSAYLPMAGFLIER